jgi:4-hydroxy-2-oxoheptanedioate aldolase
MHPSSVRAKLQTGAPIITAKASYNHPEIVELIGAFGFDAVWFCLEHRRLEAAQVGSLILACRVHQVDAIVRIKPSNYADISWLLDAGVRGLMLPRVRNVAEVQEVIAAMKFPPQGRRGFDGVQAEADFGRTRPMDYMADANNQNFLVVQIEEPEIIPHIDSLAALPGVDMLFVGPADLSLGLGKFGQMESADIQAIISQVADSCRRHGKIAGIPCPPEKIPMYQHLGFRLFNVISDFKCIKSGLAEVQDALARQNIRLFAHEDSAPSPETTTGRA